MPTPEQQQQQLDKTIAVLKAQISQQAHKTRVLRQRVIRHGGRKKAPKLFKAYQRARFDLQKLRDDLTRIEQRRHNLAHLPLRLKAYHVAETLVGVMEQGGNNSGPMVSKIIHENGGTGPEPWCGDTMAYCYRHAGSKRVQRAWASVPYLGTVFGVTRTQHPRTGDLVRFEFTGDNTPDHVGMFVKWVDDHTIETIEGNTGATGAVSDSKTGGDGVYRKHRNVALVKDFLAVHG